MVSIHAPREGCDGTRVSMMYLEVSFNSRTPGGVRPPTIGMLRLDDVVSIHAPREGCDSVQKISPRLLTCFNSRTPGGVRPEHTDSRSLGEMFQFTHPGRGATRTSSCNQAKTNVSIHAPREGCDCCCCMIASLAKSFNSRTPGGVRQSRRRSLFALS